MTIDLPPDGPWLSVQERKCGSCIFGPNSPVSPERFEDLREQWTRRGAETYQVCHQTGTWTPNDEGEVEDEDRPADDDIRVCRGWYDEMYVRRGVPVAALQIAERFGRLGFSQRNGKGFDDEDELPRDERPADGDHAGTAPR